MKLKCIIVDDEPPAIRLIEKFVEKVPFLEKTAVFSDALKALEFLNTNNIDIVFLDIQMPQITGLQLAKIIPKEIKIIFTTAYPDFALNGFELNAVDYLLKPISFERFYQAVDKLKTVSKSTPSFTENAFLFIKTDGKNKFSKVNIKDILYVEGLQNYVCIHLKGKQVIHHSSLKSILESLPSQDFIQIHKSYIIAINQIETTDNFSVFINEKELAIGATFKDAFFKRINERII